MLVELVWLMLVGCSLRVAARHLWYDRFDPEVPIFWKLFPSRMADFDNVALDSTDFAIPHFE